MPKKKTVEVGDERRSTRKHAPPVSVYNVQPFGKTVVKKKKAIKKIHTKKKTSRIEKAPRVAGKKRRVK